MDMSDFYTFKETIKKLGIKQEKLKTMILGGDIHAYCMKGEFFFKKDEVRSLKKPARHSDAA